MILNYNEFITESLILESQIIYSKKFKNVVSKIDHHIAGKLLDIEKKDVETRNNVFDIPDNTNNKISFIPDSKAKELVNDSLYFRYIANNGGWLKNKSTNDHLFEKVGYTYEEGEEPYKPNSVELGKEINRVTSESSGKTYVYLEFETGKGVYNLNKIEEATNEKLLASGNRQEIKAGKGIKAILKSSGIDVTPKELEDFVNLFKSAIDKMNDKFSLFDVVDGDDISFWYDSDNYYSQDGQLGSSCMKGKPDYYFEIYTQNPEVCSLIILKHPDDETKITGRSLLWTLTDDRKFMDRVYSRNDSDILLFHQFAAEKGWHRKSDNDSSQDFDIVAPDGTIDYDMNIKIDVKSGTYSGYPYMDTFKYLDTDSGTLEPSDNDGFELEDTDGTPSNDVCEYCNGRDYVECPDCDGTGELDCDDCSGTGEVECSECDGSGEVGEEECLNCSGTGETECDECGGGGTLECGNCDSENEVDCPECRG